MSPALNLSFKRLRQKMNLSDFCSVVGAGGAESQRGAGRGRASPPPWTRTAPVSVSGASEASASPPRQQAKAGSSIPRLDSWRRRRSNAPDVAGLFLPVGLQTGSSSNSFLLCAARWQEIWAVVVRSNCICHQVVSGREEETGAAPPGTIGEHPYVPAVEH